MLTIIHSIYNYNPIIKQALNFNVASLEALNIDYQYILFNDNGSKENETQIDPHISNNKNFNYVYSDTNYGFGKALGG